MPEKSTLPKMFWIIAGVALFWNLMGVMAYITDVTMTDEKIAAMDEAVRKLYEMEQPKWVVSAYAIAVFGGLAGSILLLLRKKLAIPVLIASVAGVAGQQIYGFFLSDTMELSGTGGMIFALLILGIALYLVYYAQEAKKKGWLS